MARIGATGSDIRGGVADSPAPADDTKDGAIRAGATSDLKACRKPVSRVRTTRGGAGAAAGSTPKKMYRPSGSSRPRPAGKKPDSGSH